ncbi:hypothetical protein WN943_003506 [Citrus x changshan-huyou]
MAKAYCKQKRRSNDVISHQEGNIDTIIEDCSRSSYGFVSYYEANKIAKFRDTFKCTGQGMSIQNLEDFLNIDIELLEDSVAKDNVTGNLNEPKLSKTIRSPYEFRSIKEPSWFQHSPFENVNDKPVTPRYLVGPYMVTSHVTNHELQLLSYIFDDSLYEK